MEAYILFQTDIYKGKRSRVFFGVYSTEIRAIEAAKENDLYTSDSEVVIIPIEIDKFYEY